MDQLVADGKLREKVYGKQKVYVVNQVGFLLIIVMYLGILSIVWQERTMKSCPCVFCNRVFVCTADVLMVVINSL